ncbi:MAG: hypothetical protein WBG36_13975 [Ornithinimicrobium sp.]
MDERQQRIFNDLCDRRPDLASMYRAALILLSEPAKAGDERTRVSHICHSMREVMNRVLRAMGINPSPRIKPSSGAQVQGLPDLLSQFPELSFDGDGDSIPVPRAAAVIFEKLIKTAVQEKRRSRDDIASLLTDDGNSAHVAVKRWGETQRFFVKWAHLHDEPTRPLELPSDDLIQMHVAVFDELFDAVITDFFERLHSIEDLLADINAVQEAGDE